MKNVVLLSLLLGLGLPVAGGSRTRTGGTKLTSKGAGRSVSTVSVRYMIDDVPAAVKFYTTRLGFRVEQDASPAFASVTRDGVRLLLSGSASSGRRVMPDGTRPVPGGWNRIELQVADVAAEARRLRAAGVRFKRNDIVTGPGGSQIWVEDPSGNLVELFQPR